jgi:hypothetical protein
MSWPGRRRQRSSIGDSRKIWLFAPLHQLIKRLPDLDLEVLQHFGATA